MDRKSYLPPPHFLSPFSLFSIDGTREKQYYREVCLHD
jgi:hypothetical protein